MKDAKEAGNKIFRFVQGEKEIFNDIGNGLEEAVKEAAVFKEKMTKGFVNSKNEMPVGATDQFKGHGSSPVIGIFGAAGRAKFRMAPKRDKFKVPTMGTAIHGAAIGGIPAVNNFFDIFHYNRSWFDIVFNNFIIIFEHLLDHVHEIIMKQSKEKNKPLPLKIEGQGS